MLRKLLISLFIISSYCSSAATFTVSNNGDNFGIDPNPGDATGTLRQAIVDANAAGGANTIDFSSSMTITLLANLPTINSNTTIDGGASVNTAAVFGSALNPIYRVTITSGVSGANVLLDLDISSGCVIKGLILLNASATGNSKLININGINNQVLGCYIGTTGSTSGASNAKYGVYISGGSNNSIGNGTRAGANVISGIGNYGYGIYITGAGADRNTIRGNIIGLQSNGVTKMTHYQLYGICITSNAGVNIIGGTGSEDGNVISGQYGLYAGGFGGRKYGTGILLTSNNALGNTVIGNRIGMQSNGINAVASNTQYYGIRIINSRNNIIGGNSSAYRNVISGNGYIPTGNSGEVWATGILIEGILSIGNSVKGNYIGPQATGTAYISSAEQFKGIYLRSAGAGNIIGGSNTGEGNVISGNTCAFPLGNCGEGRGIVLANTSFTNIIGNIIGLQADGNTLLSNAPAEKQYWGIEIDSTSTNNVIGGATSGERNIISGNWSTGVQIGSTGGGGATATANTIKGNYIGLQSDGISLVSGNIQVYGINVNGSSGNIIGGTSISDRNIISGNNYAGITLTSLGTSANLIKGNYIGPTINLTNVIGANQDYGIYFNGGANNNIVGGVSAGEANIIAFNSTNGCFLLGASTNSNKISGSPHYTNTGKQITLNYGVGGGNNNKPIPVISNVTGSIVSGTSAVGDVVEVFKNTNGNCYDAQVYLGAATANGLGNWSLAVSLVTGDYVLATARDANNNTSEFTSCSPLCPTVNSAQSSTICSNGSFTLPDGSSVNASGIYLDTLTSVDGCDSIITTNLTVKPVSTVSQNITMCNGDSVLVGSTYYYNTGNYTNTLTATNGCDSIVTTSLTESNTIAFSQNISLCQGQSIVVGGNTYNSAGTYNNMLTALNGCDSSVTTVLTIRPTYSVSQNITICNGDSILVGSTYYYNSGTYTNILAAANGCDSTVTTNLTEINSISITQNVTLCNGDSVLVGNTYYYNSGNYTTLLTAGGGCDSIVTSVITEQPLIATAQSVTICNGDSVLVGSTYYYNTGNYTTSLIAINGCDSVVSTVIIERPLVATTQSITMCNGDSVLVGATYYYSTGNYTSLLSSINGCDSTVTTNLIESPTLTTAQNISLCFGQSITVGTAIYDSAGTYFNLLTASNGCDSSVTTNLTIRPVFASTQSLSMCYGDSVLVGTTYYYNTGNYTTILTASNGCDSTVTTNLSEMPLVASSQSVTLCAGQSITVGSNTYNVSGVYIDTYAAANGCDSLYTTNLNIIQPVVTNQSHEIKCLGQTYTLPGGTVVDSAGIYNDTLPAASGCDSIVTTTVSISPAPIASFTATPTAGVTPVMVYFTNTSQYANTYLWILGDGNTSTLTNPSNIYTTPGTYTAMLIVSNGSTCYDTARITITVYEKYDITVPNVFTPNGDGTNDVFGVSGEGLKTLQGEIYDRWGLKLFEWYGVNGGWDGYTLSGETATDGTYYYILKASDYDDKIYILTGFFTLIR